MKDLFIKFNDWDKFKEWAENKTWEEVYNTCHRGDWLLCLFNKTNPNNLQLLTLTKGHCANTVKHLMEDERSIKAVDAAIAFGEKKITKDELNNAAIAAYTYANIADDSISTIYAAYAAVAAVSTTSIYDVINYVDAATDKKENKILIADICRKYLPIEIWNIN